MSRDRAPLLPAGPAGIWAGLAAAGIAALAMVLAAVALSADRLARDWTAEASSTATLQILAADEAVEAQARAALDVLRATDGVTSVRVLAVEEQRALLAPWFGTDLALDTLPLPLLIEVSADPGRLDTAVLGARLAAEAPGAVLDDHGAWRAPLVGQARGVARAAWSGVAVLGAVLGAALVLAAAGSAARHRAAIGTLRQIGARDSLIRADLARGLARPVLLGIGLGALGAAAGLAAVPDAAASMGFYLGAIAPRGADWVRLGLLAIGGAAFAYGVLHLALRRALGRA